MWSQLCLDAFRFKVIQWQQRISFLWKQVRKLVYNCLADQLILTMFKGIFTLAEINILIIRNSLAMYSIVKNSLSSKKTPW